MEQLRQKILITVTTYPLPSDKYQELVCTAGIRENGEWVRIYPIPLSMLHQKRFRKYDWIEIDLRKRSLIKDGRTESYNPVHRDLSDMEVIDHISSEKGSWEKRKAICLQKVYHSKKALIADAYSEKNPVSLATFKPAEFLDFIIEPDEREWKKEWQEQQRQLCLFTGDDFKRFFVKKVPYKFKYKFADADGEISTMMIEDWEIGQLYWNCLASSTTEAEALQKVKQKYWDEFMYDRDVYLFLGTTLKFHRMKAPNPFLIIGVFYPKRDDQLKLF